MPGHRVQIIGGLAFFVFLVMSSAQVSARAAILADFSIFHKNLNLRAGENATVYLYIVNNAEISDENCWAIIGFEIYKDNKLVGPEHFVVLIDPENLARDNQAPIAENEDVIAVFTTPGQPVTEVPPKGEWPEYVDTYVRLLGENKFHPARMVKIIIMVGRGAPAGKYLLVFPVYPWTGQEGGIQIVGETAPFIAINIITEPGVGYTLMIIIFLCAAAACFGILVFRKLQRR